MPEFRVFDKKYIEESLGKPVREILKWTLKNAPEVYPYPQSKDLEMAKIQYDTFMKEISNENGLFSRHSGTKGSYAMIRGYFSELMDRIREGYSLIFPSKELPVDAFKQTLLSSFVSREHFDMLPRKISKASDMSEDSWRMAVAYAKNRSQKEIDDLLEMHRITSSVSGREEVEEAREKLRKIKEGILKRGSKVSKEFLRIAEGYSYIT
jgi:hypothetical protein